MCRDFIRSKDLFAAPVQLTYKGQRSFNTAVGGVCSILFILVSVVVVGFGTADLALNTKFNSVTTDSYIPYSLTSPHFLNLTTTE